jgi:hypothetical protein
LDFLARERGRCFVDEREGPKHMSSDLSSDANMPQKIVGSFFPRNCLDSFLSMAGKIYNKNEDITARKDIEDLYRLVAVLSEEFQKHFFPDGFVDKPKLYHAYHQPSGNKVNQVRFRNWIWVPFFPQKIPGVAPRICYQFVLSVHDENRSCVYLEFAVGTVDKLFKAKNEKEQLSAFLKLRKEKAWAVKRELLPNENLSFDEILGWAKSHLDKMPPYDEVVAKISLPPLSSQKIPQPAESPKKRSVPLSGQGNEGYSVESIVGEGCFLPKEKLEEMVDRLRKKKNLILQGPPGTGKTWLAERLAFAVIGARDRSKVRIVQFHPNLSYEDFVRGWRPSGKGGLTLVDGIFMQAIREAKEDPDSNFAVVIEEINRGNPAQIFGELLTLLEDGKRGKDGLELCYQDADGERERISIPENLYVIGTMNIADRSLALVDLALRRRFAFVDLEPRLGPVWRDWVVEECNVDRKLVRNIEGRIIELNGQIAADARLGKQFRIGHSYVTPAYRLEDGGTKVWFQQVVETEIGPLLDEYWFDAPDETQKAIGRLVQGW